MSEVIKTLDMEVDASHVTLSTDVFFTKGEIIDATIVSKPPVGEFVEMLSIIDMKITIPLGLERGWAFDHNGRCNGTSQVQVIPPAGHTVMGMDSYSLTENRFKLHIVKTDNNYNIT